MSARVRLSAALTAVNPSPAHISTANGNPTPHTENCHRWYAKGRLPSYWRV